MEIGVGYGLGGRNLAVEGYTGKVKTTFCTTFHVFQISKSFSSVVLVESNSQVYFISRFCF